LQTGTLFIVNAGESFARRDSRCFPRTVYRQETADKFGPYYGKDRTQSATIRHVFAPFAP